MERPSPFLEMISACAPEGSLSPIVDRVKEHLSPVQYIAPARPQDEGAIEDPSLEDGNACGK